MKFFRKYKLFILPIVSLLLIAATITAIVLAMKNDVDRHRSCYVTLYSDDVLIESLLVVKGEMINPPNLEKEGYNFMGWFYDKDIWEHRFDPETPIEKNITLYAHWQQHQDNINNVVGRVNGGVFASGGSYRDFLIGTDATIIASPPEGKKFSHWILEGKSGNYFENPYTFTVAENFTFTAVFEYINPHFTVSVSGGYLDDSENKVEGMYEQNSQVVLTAIIPDEKRFVCWKLGNKEIHSNPYTLTVTENVVAVAVFDDAFEETPRGLQFDYDESEDCYVISNFVYSNELAISLPSSYDNGTNGKKPVKRIGSRAFQQSANLKRIILPKSIISIEQEAFYDCVDLSFIYIPESVTIIGENIFQGCEKLSIYCGAINKPDYWAVNWNSNISSVTWDCHSVGITRDNFQYVQTSDNTATIIGYKGTQTSISIPQMDAGMTFNAICGGAFYEHHQLKHIELPSGITNIGAEAFHECQQLLSIKCGTVTPPVLAKDSLPENSIILKIYVPFDRVNDYASAPYWNEYSSSIYSNEIIQNGLAVENGNLVQYLGDATELEIPSEITHIDMYAFVGCELSYINVSASNQNFSSIEGVLYNKEATVLIYYPNAKSDKKYRVLDTTTEIWTMAFQMNNFLEEIDLMNVETIGDYAFGNCEKINTIYLRNLNPPQFGADTIIKRGNMTYYVPNQSLEAYIDKMGTDLDIQAINL